MKGIYHLIQDTTNENNIMVYVRDEDKKPIMIWNFYSESDYAHIHSLYELEDPTNEDQPIQMGSVIRKVKLKGDIDFNTLKSNVGTNWYSTDDYDLLSIREDDVVSNLLDDEAFLRRTRILDELID